MTATTLEIPFLRGIEAEGNKSATTEFQLTKAGTLLKLDTAHNVHVRPEQADVLYKRPGATSTGPARTSRSTLGSIGSQLVVVQDSSTVMPVGATSHTIGSTYLLSELSSTNVEGLAVKEESIMTMGYADNGANSACVVRTALRGSTIKMYTQRKKDGIWRTSDIHVIGTELDPSARRAFVFCDGSRFIVFFGGNSSPNVQVMSTSTIDAPFQAPIAIAAGAKLLDVVEYSGGWLVLYEDTFISPGRLKIVPVSTSFIAGASTSVTVAGPVNPTVAGLVWVGGTTVHVWHGGYTADSNTLYLHQVVLGGASSLLTTVANALGSGNTLSAMAVGGGSAVAAAAGGTEAASYCYVTAGAGPTAKLGRIWRATIGSVQANNNYCGAIYPRSRLWTSSTFFGARLFGVQSNIYGVWQLTASNTVAGNVVESYPLVYHSVTLGKASPITYDLIPRGNSLWVSSDGTQAKAVMWGENGAHTAVAHVGYAPSTGQIVSHGGMSIMLGGVPRYYDGVELVPVGIPQFPSFTLTPSTGSSMVAGVYAYAVVWEYFDRLGRRQQSPASVQTVTVAANGQVSLVIDPSTQPLDERQTGVTMTALRARIYRTEPGGNVLRTADNAILGTAISTRFSSTTVYTFSDNGSSYNFSNGEPLYSTTSGSSELDSYAMESTLALRGFSDRVLSIGTLFPEAVTYTKTLRQGRAFEANPALNMLLPEALTGLAYQDGNVYCFSATNVWGLNPSFADDTGQGAGGVDPIPLSTGVGCTQPLSIVETGVGVFFAGPRGIYMIARGGGPPAFVGLQVEPIYQDYPNVSGASHNSRTHEVVWTLNNGVDHRVLVYNYQYGQWFTWRIGHPTTHSVVLTTLDGGVTCVAGNYVFGQRGLAAQGQACMVLTDSSTQDVHDVGGTAEIPIEVTSRDISLPGSLGGQTRVLSMTLDASGSGSSAVLLSESHDSGATWSTERTINTGTSNPPIYQFVKQKTRGVRFRIRTTTGVSPLVLSGVSLRVSGLGKSFTASTYRRG